MSAYFLVSKQGKICSFNWKSGLLMKRFFNQKPGSFALLWLMTVVSSRWYGESPLPG